VGDHLRQRGWLVRNGRLGGVDGRSVECWTGAPRLHDRWRIGCVHNLQHVLPRCRRAGRARCRVPRRALRLAVGEFVNFGVVFRIVAEPPTPHVSVQKISVTADEEGLRLDRWFRAKFPEVTHVRLEKLLRKGEVRVNGGRVRAGLRLETGMLVRIPPLPAPQPATRPGPVALSDVIALRDRILYRDDVLIAIDKPAGLAVQGGSGTPRHLDGMLDTLQFEAPDRPRLSQIEPPKKSIGLWSMVRQKRTKVVWTRVLVKSHLGVEGNKWRLSQGASRRQRYIRSWHDLGHHLLG
jgi:hypothetical protein